MGQGPARQLVRVTASAAAAVVLLVVSGCASEDAATTAEGEACEKTFTIAYSHSVSEAAIVKQVRNFADKRAAEVGCVKMLHDNTQANSLQEQLAAVETWITQKVDAIVVTPIDTAALDGLRTRAQGDGIEWLTYLGPMKGSDGFVGFDHAESGKLVATAAVEWAKKEFPNGGAKALVTTLTGLPSLSPRWEEATKVLKAGGIEVVAMQDSANQQTGLQVTEDTLRQHPDLSIVIGLNDDAAVGAYRAFQNKGVNVQKSFIGGQDGSIEGLQAIKEGKHYKASAAILLEELGANIVDLSLNAVKGSGETERLAPVVLASLDDQSQLDKLIAQFN